MEFGIYNPDLAVNLTQEMWQTTYMLTGNTTVISTVASAAADVTSYVTPGNTWTCSLEDDLNNVSIVSSALDKCSMQLVNLSELLLLGDIVEHRNLCSCSQQQYFGVSPLAMGDIAFVSMYVHLSFK